MGAYPMTQIAISTAGWQVSRPSSLSDIWPSVTSRDLIWGPFPYQRMLPHGRQVRIGELDVLTENLDLRQVPFDADATDLLVPSPDQSNEERRSWAGAFNLRLSQLSTMFSAGTLLISLDALRHVATEAPQIIPNELHPPAIVPTDEGYIELEWRMGQVHVRVAFDGGDGFVWIDDMESDEFESGTLARMRERLRDSLRAMSAA